MPAKYTYLNLVKRPDGVALIKLDYPDEKVNKLSTRMAGDIKEVLDEIEKDDEIRAVVLASAKPDSFIVGADIEELSEIPDGRESSRRLEIAQTQFNRVEASKKPFVAAIHGPCMGGGLEFALCCHCRIATDHPKTALALPEVKLGIFPAAGGTQRLPRLIGLQQALDMLLTGKTVFPHKAKKLGLIDDVVVPYDLEGQAVEAALRLAREGVAPRRRKRSLAEQAMEDLGPARDMALNKAREMVLKQTKGNLPGPLHIIECVRTGLEEGQEAGLARERELFGQVINTPVSKELMNLFFAVTAKKKHPLAKGASEVKNVGVLGAGLMGAGIALVNATHTPCQTLLKDVSEEAVAGGRKYIFKEVEKRHQKGVYTRVQRDRILGQVTGLTDYVGFDRADLVIEAVFEDLDIKQKVLAETEAATRDDCVFASNTSAIPIHRIAQKARRPENVLGMHYFSPVHRMPLLEIITTEKTSKRAVQTAVGFGLAQGKTVIVVKDGPGFYTTRILAPYLNEAQLLLSEGATVEAVDRACARFGYPIGPIQLMDEVGLDVAAHVADDMVAAFGDRLGSVSDGARKLVEAGYKGRKNKKGFYLYDRPAKKTNPLLSLIGRKPKKGKEVDPAIYAFFGGERKAMEEELLNLRCVFACLNEAAICLQEGVIESPTDGDLGAVLGLGFPPFRGGPFRFADAFGLKNLIEKMESYAARFGARFAPAQILLDCEKAQKTFY